MTDQELRALVRDAVQRHLGAGSVAAAPQAIQPAPAASAPMAGLVHPSHGIYIAIVNTDDRCVIEQDVPCTHCDYCKSHGH